MNNLHGIIFAYSSNVRLKELTQHRTASSIPFGGRYRVIDFMLSNMVNAGVDDVGVIMRENYQSLLDHLGSGKDWDLSRKRGGLRLLPPFAYAGVKRDTATYRGWLDALYSITSYLSHIRQDYVVLADGDLVVNLPLEDIFNSHIKSGADITCVCVPEQMLLHDDSAHFVLDAGGRVTDVLIGKPEEGNFCAMGVTILSRQLLENLLAHCAAHNQYEFNRDILQNMREKLNIMGYVHHSYSTRLQSVTDYFQQSMNLLDPKVRNDLFSRERPIKTKVRDEASAYYGPSSRVKNSVIADGCFIEGEVENSVIFRGVKIGEGAVVKNCILMQDTQIHSGANVTYAITDKEVVINRGTKLVGHEAYPMAVSKGSVI